MQIPDTTPQADAPAPAPASPSPQNEYAQKQYENADATSSPYKQPAYAPQAIPGQPTYYFSPQTQGYYPSAQPVAGSYPPQQPGAFYVVQVPPQTPPREEGCCVTPDWIFFGVGWVLSVFWVIGAFLPLCRTPKFANNAVKAGWVANCVMIVVYIVVVLLFLYA
ncbi:hypothetical protein KFL_002270130 [Klebsormidium nitens]|uniref:60S ribosomal protein L18a-like protein n=1 Tax=Klebsormidium nitens TaxID=105231 RepID=A0A1Y1I775_KLENI|nr:hypothetical protein KFL_002270130 [Klebsormidium nitens]|eukprot:GAQ85279.1 hypothetical protein KFL_002270130 [Klebsormidium nitens]